MDAENTRTLAAFGTATFAADRDTLAAIFARPDKIPYVARRGSYIYNFWTDAQHPRGLWRRTSLESFRRESPDWDVILDIDALAASEKEDWIWSGASTRARTHDRAILRLSRGGSDAIVLREFDLERKAFVPGGFSLPEAKGSLTWLDADTLLLSSALGDSTTPGYARTVRLWRRGADPAIAPVLFEVAPDHMSAAAGVDLSQQPATVWFHDSVDFFNQHVWLADASGSNKVRLDIPTDSQVDAHGGWMAIKLRTAWTVGGKTYPGDGLLGIRLEAFRTGNRDFTVLFEAGTRRSLQGFFWSAGRLVLSILDDLRPVFEVATPADGVWTKTRLTGLPEIGVVGVSPLDVEESEANGDLMASVQDPLTPPSLLLIAIGEGPTILKQSPPAFSPAGLVVTRHEAISVDGERIPYVQTGPAAKDTGDAPVYVTGYGGFAISMLPTYNSAIGKLWLERGGTSVTANIRGGGEFGTPWHEAGRGAGKRLTHDDFAAVAADLVRRGVTRPGRIAAEGGSNGGILIANMLTRYPERFGALLCTIPLIDMRRYTKLLAGASWIAEYGDPDKPEEWAWLQTYSAYHQAVPGQAYPPILIATTRRDDRVHPGHARKMAAKLQAMGYGQAYFYEPGAGGHGYGKDDKERASFYALGYAFLRDKIGWEPEARRPG